MKPHRISLTNSLVFSFGLHKKMAVSMEGKLLICLLFYSL